MGADKPRMNPPAGGPPPRKTRRAKTGRRSRTRSWWRRDAEQREPIPEGDVDVMVGDALRFLRCYGGQTLSRIACRRETTLQVRGWG